MAQKDIEMILMRQLASCLATPVFIVDLLGNLVFYNEPAEAVLGLHFEHTGPMSVSEWAAMFHPFDEDEKAMPAETMPLVIVLKTQRPAHKRFWIRGLDGVKRQIEVTAIPLIGQGKQLSGAVSFFQEVSE